MKRFILLLTVTVLTGMFGVNSAQEKTLLSDRDLINQYKQEIKILELEIKTVRVKLKADRENSELKTDLTTKSNQLSELKAKKNVIDKAIKSKAAAEKAAEKAENARKKADKAAADAKRIKEG
ncbi:MAG: hypothetical protein LBJ47_06380 [Tannerella sp.]|nr:hypothetical protein [Tannerella sp.]